jgi:hypothetical protein
LREPGTDRFERLLVTQSTAVGVGWGGIASLANNTYTAFTEDSYTLVERDV